MRNGSRTMNPRRIAFAAILLLLPVIIIAGSSIEFATEQPGIVRGPNERNPQSLGSVPFMTPSPTARLPPGATPQAKLTPTLAPSATIQPTRPSYGLVPSPTPAPTETPTPEPLANRFIIPSAGIRAVVETQGLDAKMVMQVLDDPFQVAWYDFTAKPGTPGNTVFAGHVDHIRVGRAVFWNLRNVGIGDIMEYHSIDGQVFRYRVTRITTQKATDPARVNRGIAQ